MGDELPPRPLWTTSRVVGSPEPPPPYTVEPAFTKIDWKDLVFAIREPGSKWLIVVQSPQTGSSARALRVLDRADAQQTDVLLEFENRLIYSLAFHPDYEANGQIFVCSKTQQRNGVGTNNLSRLVNAQIVDGTVDCQPACKPDSEVKILEWDSQGHDGGAVVFGHDGMLYVTTGDGTGDSDDELTAQDPTNLLGCVLRIDVDHQAVGMPYSIPPDNPFLDVEGARGEIWSLGHRNPWRMTVDAKTGHLWVGNNGQDLWEYAHLIRRGDNCGWSIFEGSHPFYLNRQRGPGQFAPPTVEHHHGEFRSLTGGVVYYGEQLPDLAGAYVYGDYSTGAIWAVRHDGKRIIWNRELAKTTIDIVGFATSHRDELLVVGNTSGIHRVVKSTIENNASVFPQKLTETGLFSSVKDHRPAAGVVPYSVNAPGWSDGAAAERLLALPDGTSIKRGPQSGQWEFADGTVAVQTLSLGQQKLGREPPRRIETRIITKQLGIWSAYSYLWNDSQNDATLVPTEGAEVPLPSVVATSDHGATTQTWKIPSRTDCNSCHSRAAGFVLGLNDLQMDRQHTYDGITAHQFRAFECWGMFDQQVSLPSSTEPDLVNPYDTSHDLETRARSYLHCNCAACHVTAGGGNSRIQLNFQQDLAQMQLVGAPPQHSTFGVAGPLLVAPAEPQRSILIHRISRRGPGQMPPRGTHVIDEAGVELIHDWILQLTPQRAFVKHWKLADLSADLVQLGQGRSYKAGETAFGELRCSQCHRFANLGGGAGPHLNGVATKRSARELLESILEPSKSILPEFAATVVVTIHGELLQGRIQQEDDESIVLSSADALGMPRALPKHEIDQRYLSPNSTMPDGLLDTATKEQILDLLAYLISEANSDHPAFTK